MLGPLDIFLQSVLLISMRINLSCEWPSAQCKHLIIFFTIYTCLIYLN